LAHISHFKRALSTHDASELQNRRVLVLLPTKDLTPGEVARLKYVTSRLGLDTNPYCSAFPVGLQITFTHAGHHPGSDRDFVSHFLDLYVRSRCTIYQALKRSLHPGRLAQTNVIIRCSPHQFTVCAYLPNQLWLGSKMCCVGDTENKGKPGVVACGICHRQTKGISCIQDTDRDPLSKIHLLTPQLLGSALTDPAMRYETCVPLATWVSLPTEQFWELPTWEFKAPPVLVGM
jgi:hypothetical protein